MKSAPKDWFLAGVLVLLNVAFFSDVLFSDSTFFARDLSVFHYPLKRLVTESYAKGEWPLWNPYVQMGQPLLANPNSLALYPTQILFQFLPFEIAFELHMVLHCMIAGCAAFFLARKLDLGPQPSFLAAVIYNFSGITLSCINLFNILPIVTFLPLLSLVMVRVIRCPGWWTVLAAACSFSCFFLLLEPLSSSGAVFFVFAIVTLFVRFPKATPRDLLRILGLLVLPILIGVLVASVQILPSLELARNSGRKAGFDLHVASFWSLHPINLLQMIFPRVFGEYFKLNAPVPWAGRFFENREPYFLSCYFGFIPLLLALIAVWGWKGQRTTKTICFALAIATVLAFGKYTRFYGWLFEYFPILRLGRYPIKFLLVLNLCMALLAGLGWKCIEQLRIEKPSEVQRRARFVILAVFGLFLASVSLLSVRSWSFLHLAIVDQSIESFTWSKFNVSIPVSIAFAALKHLLLQLLFVLVGAVLIIRNRTSVFASVVPIVFVLLDLFASNAWINPLVKAEFYELSPVAAYLQRQENKHGLFRVFRIEPPRLQDHPSVIYQSDSVVWLSIYRNLTLYPMLSAKDHVQYAAFPSIDQLETSTSQDTIRVLASAETLEKKLAILRTLNVRYVISPISLDNGELTLEALFKVNSDQPLRLFRLLDYSPRVFLTNAASNQSDLPITVAQQRNMFPNSRLQLTEYGSNEVRLEAVVERDANLVLLDNAYPGWHGFVDGKEIPIQQYQGKYRLLRISAGSHEVDFHFEPQSFRCGLWISGLTLFGCMAVSLMVTLRPSSRPGCSHF